MAANDASCFPRLLKTLPLSNLALAAPLLGYAAAICAALWALVLLVAWNAGNADFVSKHGGGMALQLVVLPWVLAALWVPIERVWLRLTRGVAVYAAFSLSYTSPLDASSMTARTLVILCAVLVAGWFAAAQAAARDRSRRSPRTSRAARPHKR